MLLAHSFILNEVKKGKVMIDTKVGLLGCGEMGSALIRGVIPLVGKANVFLFNRTVEKAENLSKKLKVSIVQNEKDLLSLKCTYIFLAVKPYAIKESIEKLFNGLDTCKTTLVSVAAGVSIQDITDCLPENQKKSVSIIRLMPNTPCQVGQGMIGLSASDSVDDATIDELTKMLKGAGVVEQVGENLLDAVTALSGSGVAYGFIFIEALADAGVQFGMTRKQAYVYAAQMLKGAGSMVLETGLHPAVLKDGVCSPGGITIKALESLEENGFRSAIIQAAKTAFEVSKGLGK